MDDGRWTVDDSLLKKTKDECWLVACSWWLVIWAEDKSDATEQLSIYHYRRLVYVSGWGGTKEQRSKSCFKAPTHHQFTAMVVSIASAHTGATKQLFISHGG
jgi:hypothetical protein